MTTDILVMQPLYAHRSFVAELFRRHPLFAGAALCLLVLMATDPVRHGAGRSARSSTSTSGIKPFKFQVALAIYLATLAWFAGWLPATRRGERAGIASSRSSSSWRSPPR